MARKLEHLQRDLSLTPREIQVLQYAAGGKTVRETALLMDLAPGTVKNQRAAAMRRLKAVSLTHAVAIAMRARKIR